MDSGRGMVPALCAAAAERPEAPFLFTPRGWEVVWRSWGAVAAQVAAGARELTALELRAGSPVAYRWTGGPDALAADLAIQAAGLDACPELEPLPVSAGAVAPSEEEGAGPSTVVPAARFLLPGEEPPAPSDRSPEPPDERTALPTARLPEIGPDPHRAPSPPPELHAAAGRGGARVLEPGSPEPVRWDEERSARAGATVAERLAAARTRVPRPEVRGTGGREVVAAWVDPRLAGGRSVLAWALAAGAALLLEPERRSLAGTASWARPTVVALPVGDLPLLAALVRERERRRARRRRWLRFFGRPEGPPPRPLDRLSTLLLTPFPDGPTGGFRRLSADEIGFWAERGVVLERIG